MDAILLTLCGCWTPSWTLSSGLAKYGLQANSVSLALRFSVFGRWTCSSDVHHRRANSMLLLGVYTLVRLSGLGLLVVEALISFFSKGLLQAGTSLSVPCCLLTRVCFICLQRCGAVRSWCLDLSAVSGQHTCVMRHVALDPHCTLYLVFINPGRFSSMQYGWVCSLNDTMASIPLPPEECFLLCFNLCPTM